MPKIDPISDREQEEELCINCGHYFDPDDLCEECGLCPEDCIHEGFGDEPDDSDFNEPIVKEALNNNNDEDDI